MKPFGLQASDVRNYNNFGTLRLLFASLVILAHSPEMTDGNRSREILTRIFGTISLGELAVDGFFLVSGYLITKSCQNSRSAADYLLKRVLRIYPGFVVAFLVSSIIVAPVVGGDFAQASAIKDFLKLVLLGLPKVPGAFADLHQPALNGSLWTIAYEFRCYILVILVGYIFTHLGRRGYAAFLLLLTAIYALRGSLPDVSENFAVIFGGPNILVRLAFVFFVGSGFYIWREWVVYTHRRAFYAAVLLAVFMYIGPLAEPAVAVLGGYLVFWYAFSCKANSISRIMDHTDPSYGLYLYAWPIQNTLIFFFVGISPWMVAVITLPVALLMGLISWYLVEKPALRFKGFLSPVWAAIVLRFNLGRRTIQ